jgi:hypothetical protein
MKAECSTSGHIDKSLSEEDGAWDPQVSVVPEMRGGQDDR